MVLKRTSLAIWEERSPCLTEATPCSMSTLATPTYEDRGSSLQGNACFSSDIQPSFTVREGLTPWAAVFSTSVDLARLSTRWSMTAVEWNSRSCRGRRCLLCSPHSSSRDRWLTSYTEDNASLNVSFYKYRCGIPL